MQSKTRFALETIIDCCDDLKVLANGLNKDDFETDRIRLLAAERLFTVIGEAMVRVRDLEPRILNEISSWRQIIGLRNVLVHGYDQVDLQLLLKTIHKSIPLLQVEVESILGTDQARANQP